MSMIEGFSSNLNNNENERIHLIRNEYRKLLSGKIEESRIPIDNFPILMPHNIAIVLDNKTIHVILDLTNAAMTASRVVYDDFRKKEDLDPETVVILAKRDLGFKTTIYRRFPISFLDMEENKLKEAIKNIAYKEFDGVEAKLNALSKAGFTEAFEYLRNARQRLESNDSTGFADCKTNCRNALVSAIKAITGLESIKDGIKKMCKEGYFGEREEEFFSSLESIFSKIYNIQSKKGPHAPMPTKLEALFTLRLTEASIDFLAQIKLNKSLTEN